MINRVDSKREAKAILRRARVSPLLMGGILLLVSFVLGLVQNLVEYGSLWPAQIYSIDVFSAVMEGNYEAVAGVMEAVPESTLYSIFFAILSNLFMTILSAGFYLYCMGIRQGKEIPCGVILDGLGSAGRLIWCGILMYIKIFLWSLLFVFPGIVAAYRYRFSYFNILADESVSAGEAIRLSCRQTRGMKFDLFVLDLSFIGWQILSDITLGILGVWLMPYQTVCVLSYFEEGQRRLGRAPYGQNSWEPME